MAEESDEGTRPGPIYDNAMRLIVEGNLAAAFGLLGEESLDESEQLPTDFPAVTRSADLLVRTGSGRLVHVEYARRAKADLVPRMLLYRALIMGSWPGQPLSQHIIVLGEGRVRGHDDLRAGEFWLNLNVVYLRDLDPEVLLRSPGLEPFAVLGSGDHESVLRRAVQVINAAGGSRAAELRECAAVLGRIHLPVVTIERIIEEAGMTFETFAEEWRDTRTGQIIRQEGRQEGREEGREMLLAALLRQRFGDQDGVAAASHRLAAWPEDAALRAITAAATLDDLPDDAPFV